MTSHDPGPVSSAAPPAGSSCAEHATSADATSIAQLLARAYLKNPLMRWVLRDASTREAATQTWLRPSIDRYLASGVVHVVRSSGDVVGVAAWRTGAEPLPPAPHEGMTPAQSLASLVGQSEADRVLAALAGTAAHAPGRPSSYLNYLAVSPDLQGQGLGTTLLRAGTDLADARGLATWLATSDPTNLPFYERAGYAVVARRQLADGPVLAVLHQARQEIGSGSGSGSANQTTVSP